MRYLIVCLSALSFCSAAVAQDQNPLATALRKSAKIPVLEADDKLTRLLKKSHNAALEEFRQKHNYWVQGDSSADDVLKAMDRLQELRREVRSETDERKLLEQKISFAKRMEKEAAAIRRTYGQESLRQLGKATAAAYRAAAELQLARLDAGKTKQDDARR